MNRHQKIIGQLSQLRGVLDDARAILEWHRLAIFEKKLNPSSRLSFQDDAGRQLLDKRAAFGTLWTETCELLHDRATNLISDKQVAFQKELDRIALQFKYLGSDVRIY